MTDIVRHLGIDTVVECSRCEFGKLDNPEGLACPRTVNEIIKLAANVLMNGLVETPLEEPVSLGVWNEIPVTVSPKTMIHALARTHDMLERRSIECADLHRLNAGTGKPFEPVLWINPDDAFQLVAQTMDGPGETAATDA
jgi:hypothetical protein